MFSENANEILKIMGDFGPTKNIKEKEIKGTQIDDWNSSYSIYINSNELRQYAAGLIEVADWLDKRSEDAN